MVIAAVPETLNLLQSDGQVANRFDPLFLPRWKLGDEFSRLLVFMEKALALKDPSGLAQPEVAQLILEQTDGIIGYMTTLLQLLAERAIRSRAERITLAYLSTAGLKRLGWV